MPISNADHEARVLAQVAWAATMAATTSVGVAENTDVSRGVQVEVAEQQ